MAEGGQNQYETAVSKESPITTTTTNNTSPTSASSFSTPSNSNSSMWLMQPFVNFAEVELQEKVGHGSYGVVYKAVWKNRYVGVKEFGPSAEQKAIETEVKQLSRVRHPNIIALYGISEDQQSTYLIMEYAEGGSLHNFLHGKVKPPYSKSHAMSWAYQCAEGVAYLHAMKPKPLIHRDLKPLNLLLTNKGRHLKICDFGTVADKSTWMTNNKGSAAWMAPEVFEGSKYTEKCDVFSWAIVLWEVLSRQQPFKDIDNTYSIMWKIHKGERPAMIKDWPERIQKLMTSCWATAPDLRPSMQHVVDIMRELAASYPDGDEPLEYEFVNQQIIQTGDQTNANIDSTESGFGNFLTSNSTSVSSQATPTDTTSDHSTNTSSSSTPTNSIDSLKPKSNTPRWSVIPEEQESGTSQESLTSNPFCLTPSAESTKRYNTIRNAMMQMASVPMLPINLSVDPNAWELPASNEHSFVTNNSFSKSDGKERLTVTDAKPMMPQPIGNSNLSNNNESDEDDSDNDGPDQSLHEILDPELQPEQPIPDNAQSQEIYEEHRRLAKEYLRVDTKLYYAQALKEKLLMQMDPAERQEKQELLKKMSEKEELLELYNNLKQQLENIRSGQQPNAITSSATQSQQPTSQQDDIGIQNELVSEVEDWVVVAPNEQNT